MPPSRSRSTGFKSQVAKIAHKQWLYSEAESILKARADKNSKLSKWNGNIYTSFDHGPEEVHKRPEKDYGLVLQGETGEELPCLIIQSCWSKKYKHMFNEMQRWMQWGEGMVQVVILLKWSLVSVEDSLLAAEIEVYEYAPKSPTSYKKIFNETLNSVEEKDLPPVLLTTKQLFGAQRPRGRGASYSLSLNNLWKTALNIFDKEVSDYHKRIPLNSPDSESDSGTASGRASPDMLDSGRSSPDILHMSLEPVQTVELPMYTSPAPDLSSCDSNDSVVLAMEEKDSIHDTTVEEAMRLSEPKDENTVVVEEAEVIPVTVESQPVQAQSAEAQPTEPQSVEPQSVEAQRTEAQAFEPLSVESTEAQSAKLFTVEPQSVESQLVVETQPDEPQPVESQTEEPQSVEPQFVEPQPVELLSVKLQATELQAVEPQSVEPQPVEAQSVESQSVEHQAVEYQAAEYQAVEHQAVEHQAVELQSVEPQSVEPQSVEPQSVEPQPVEPQFVESAEPQPVESQPVEPQPVESQSVEHQAVEHQAVEPQSVEPQAVEHQAVEPQSVEPQSVEHQSVELQSVEPQSVEPQSVEPQSVEHQAVEPQSVEPQAVEPQAVEPQAVEPQSVESHSVESQSVELQAVEHQSVELQSVEHQAVEPQSVEPQSVEPQAVEFQPELVEVKSAEAQSTEIQSLESQSAEPQSPETQSLGTQSADPQPDELQSIKSDIGLPGGMNSVEVPAIVNETQTENTLDEGTQNFKQSTEVGASPSWELVSSPDMESNSDSESENESDKDHEANTQLIPNRTMLNEAEGMESDSDDEELMEVFTTTTTFPSNTSDNVIHTKHVHTEESIRGGMVVATRTEVIEECITEPSEEISSTTHSAQGLIPPTICNAGEVKVEPASTSKTEMSATQNSQSSLLSQGQIQNMGPVDQLQSMAPTQMPTELGYPNDPASVFQHLPPGFASGGVIGPFSWYGLIIYTTVMTSQPVAQETLDMGRSLMLGALKEFTEKTHKKYPSENVGPLTLTTEEGTIPLPKEIEPPKELQECRREETTTTRTIGTTTERTEYPGVETVTGPVHPVTPEPPICVERPESSVVIEAPEPPVVGGLPEPLVIGVPEIPVVAVDEVPEITEVSEPPGIPVIVIENVPAKIPQTPEPPVVDEVPEAPEPSESPVVNEVIEASESPVVNEVIEIPEPPEPPVVHLIPEVSEPPVDKVPEVLVLEVLEPVESPAVNEVIGIPEPTEPLVVHEVPEVPEPSESLVLNQVVEIPEPPKPPVVDEVPEVSGVPEPPVSPVVEEPESCLVVEKVPEPPIDEAPEVLKPHIDEASEVLEPPIDEAHEVLEPFDVNVPKIPEVPETLEPPVVDEVSQIPVIVEKVSESPVDEVPKLPEPPEPLVVDEVPPVVVEKLPEPPVLVEQVPEPPVVVKPIAVNRFMIRVEEEPEQPTPRELLSQLESLLNQINQQTGKLPKINFSMTCEVREDQYYGDQYEDEDEEFEIMVKYKARKRAGIERHSIWGEGGGGRGGSCAEMRNMGEGECAFQGLLPVGAVMCN